MSPKHELKPRTRFDAKNRVHIPKWICDELGIKPGDLVEIDIYDHKLLLTILGR